MAIKPYVLWKVGTQEFKLKLRSQDVVNAEEELNMNLMDVLMATDDGKMPPLGVMLKITHYAMNAFNHGVKEEEMFEIFDEYIEQGGDQTAFMEEILVPLYEVSGFFKIDRSDEKKEVKKPTAKVKSGQ